MLFEACSPINSTYSSLFSTRINDYEEALVSKQCSFFQNFDVFTLVSDDIETIDRLMTRCLKPRTPDKEREEIMELIQNIGISSKLKQNEIVYQRCCAALWQIGKKYSPLVIAKNKQELTSDFHLRLKVWNFIYRLCYSYGSSGAASGIFDCKEEIFMEILNLIKFGNLLKVAEFHDRAIPCSCVEMSWKLIESHNSNFAKLLMDVLQTKTLPSSIDHPFAISAFNYVSKKASPKLYIKVFYKLFPSFFNDYAAAGRILKYLHSKISTFSPEIYENLIECFGENLTFIEYCESLLNDFVKQLNNVKDSITANHFPNTFSSISEAIDEYSLPPKMSDDNFQLFLRLLAKAVNDSKVADNLVPLLEKYWGQVRVPRIYSFYLMSLAIVAKALNPKLVLSQVCNLFGDDICPRETLWLRFYVLQRCMPSEFKELFNQLKPKLIVASSSNFSFFIEAFSCTVAPYARPNSTEDSLFLNLFSVEFIRNLKIDDIPKFIKGIHKLSPLPSLVFELFLKEFSIDVTFAANFFAYQSSQSNIPSIDEKVFRQKFVTCDFAQSLVEAIVRQNTRLLPNNGVFGYQMALIFCFTPSFIKTSNGKDSFIKFINLISNGSADSIQSCKQAIYSLDSALKSNTQLCSKVYSKWIFEVMDQNVKNNDDCISNSCELICEILSTESFKIASQMFLKTLKSINEMPQVYIIRNFVEKYLIQTDLADTDLHRELLRKLISMKLTPYFLDKNKAFVEKIEANLKSKLENLDF